MTNEAMTKALNAAAVLLRATASGSIIKLEDTDERLRYWAGQLEQARDELAKRNAAHCTLINAFNEWRTIQENG